MTIRKLARLVLFALALITPHVAWAQVSVDKRLAPGQPPLVIAHRAAVMGGWPENSLGAIQYAIDRGIEAIHINPQLTADDQYVLMHDHTLNRTTDVESVFPHGPPGGPSRASRGGKDYVRDYTLDQIRQLRLLGESGEDDESVPMLGEALDLVDGRRLVLLGLKSYEVDSLAAALGGRDTENLLLFELYFSGTDQSKLREASSTTDIAVAVSLFQSRNYRADFEAIFEQLGPAIKMVSVASAGLTPEFVTRLQELEVVLVIGSGGPEDSAIVNDDPGPWQSVLERGYSVSTDQPDLVLELLGQ